VENKKPTAKSTPVENKKRTAKSTAVENKKCTSAKRTVGNKKQYQKRTPDQTEATELRRQEKRAEQRELNDKNREKLLVELRAGMKADAHDWPNALLQEPHLDRECTLSIRGGTKHKYIICRERRRTSGRLRINAKAVRSSADEGEAQRWRVNLRDLHDHSPSVTQHLLLRIPEWGVRDRYIKGREYLRRP
jgi:hypothetical protein